MLSLFDPLRDFQFASIAFRMVVSFLCGGLIGIEREYKRRSAGFRTHILICLGAAVTTLTSQYLCLQMGYATDLARLGAQVIAGIGFIGAGSILVTRRQKVKGLTTAAGLWAAAIIGLCFGAGFYEGGLLATVMILLVESFLFKIERLMLRRSPEISLFVEYHHKATLTQMITLLRNENIKVLNMEITRIPTHEKPNASVLFLLRLPKKRRPEEILPKITEIEHVISAEII